MLLRSVPLALFFLSLPYQNKNNQSKQTTPPPNIIDSNSLLVNMLIFPLSLLMRHIKFMVVKNSLCLGFCITLL